MIDWDQFFFYGENVMEKKIENEFDIWMGILQPKRDSFYFRRDGAGIEKSENAPNGLSLLIGVRFNIANWFAYRNSYIADGRNNLSDRRLAVSQQSISIEQDRGDMNVSIFYIPFSDYKNMQKTEFGI